ncbi:MAG: diacylglycerol/lipid kinase family protein [Solirubrobacterales bacterium]
MRLALLTNPGSGSGDAGEVAELLREHDATFESFDLDAVGDALASGPERIVVAGGDGSLGAAAEAAANAGVPLAVVPVGTANDFVRALELPDAVPEAVRLAVTGRRTRRLDLARIGDRPFLNAASAGLAPAAARRARGLKPLLGAAAYAVGAARAAIRTDPITCRATCDGVLVFEGRAWQVTVACSGAFGGGSGVEADPHDGALDLVVVEAGSRIRLALRAWGLRAGSLESQRGVHSRRCGRVELDVPPQTAFNVDGELIESGPAEFTVEPGAVELVVG